MKPKHSENYAIVFDGINFASSKTNDLTSSVMTTISVNSLSQAENLQRWSVALIGSTGIHYDNPVPYIPNVISDTEDDYIPVTSSIGVTRSRS